MASTQKAAEHAEKVVDASVEKWDSYVSELGRADGEFIGRGAEALGLYGAPENGATWSLMNGIHPVTGERFHTPYWTRAVSKAVYGNKKKVGVPAYAAVFAAPKSVSLLMMTGYREQTLAAHRAAFAEAMRFIESQWYVRDRAGSHESLGVLATAYEHHTSRIKVPEPHLHTHVSFMNFAQRASDGKWLAVDYAHFLRAQKAAGTVYQAALRRELALGIPGIEFELREDGTADVAQIPAEVRDVFSTRHFEVLEEEQRLAEAGVRPGLKRMDYAGYKTRTAKGEIDPRMWLAEQRELLAEYGITDRAIAAWAEQEQSVTPTSWEVRRAELTDRLFGPNGLTEKSNFFNRWDVMEQVGIAHYTDMESFEQLMARTDELLADPRVMTVDADGRYSVKELKQLEQSVRDAARSVTSSAGADLGRRERVNTRMRAAEARHVRRLNVGQRAMIEGIAVSGRNVEIVEALAGSGKTTSLGVLAEILEQDGYRVIGVAPTGRARVELIQSAGIRESYTLAEFKLRAENLVTESDRPIALLADEAAFAATRELAASVSPVLRERGRAVLIGDSGQLGSVGAGGLFAAISRERASEGAVIYRLDQVMRQQTPEGKTDHFEVRALQALHNRDADLWVRLREQRGQLHIHTGRHAGSEAIEQAAEMYLEALELCDATDLYLLTADNQVRAVLNERVRAELVARGVIVEAGAIDGRRFAQGERIALRKNDNDKDLANGMRATILHVDATRGTLTVAVDGEHGGIQTLDRDYVTGMTESRLQFVQGGYANTVHTSQGGTVNRTIIVSAAQDLDKERGYVAASRARHATDLITWDGSAPEYFAEHELSSDEQVSEVHAELLDALQRSGVESSVTERIAEAAEQLQLDFASEEGAAADRAQTAHSAEGETVEAQRREDRLEATPEELTAGEEQVAATIDRQEDVEHPVRNETEAARERALADYHKAVAAAGAEKHHELEALRDQLNTARRRLQSIRDEFENTNAQAKQVGELATSLEQTFPSGYGMPSGAERLTHYQRALEREASATKRKDIRQWSEAATAIRSNLPTATQRLLDAENTRGVDDRVLLSRYQESRSGRDQLHNRCREIWTQLQDGDEIRPNYDPGSNLIAEIGMGKANELEARVASVESAIQTLNDPQQAIRARVAKALETNQIYNRPPASIQEANAWSHEWNYGLLLEDNEGVLRARIQELPLWSHPLEPEQMLAIEKATQRGRELGEQLHNLGMSPQQAAIATRRASNSQGYDI